METTDKLDVLPSHTMNNLYFSGLFISSIPTHSSFLLYFPPFIRYVFVHLYIRRSTGFIQLWCFCYLTHEAIHRCFDILYFILLHGCLLHRIPLILYAFRIWQHWHCDWIAFANIRMFA